ncbi:hypothetical protein RLQ69_000855 [Campylobacter jejuni]|uniref:Uncharacterized protein n=1 Tax=Campylobacter jejuni TaxID=197 RepID=A0A690V072_CAMJU|nr:hypothetical protein [Campylobacter jejuni]EAJ5193632.1 hypothetical protein [Campylobacter jejuni]EAK0574301.1 hypothetical protein [Campylobacter jejuni]EDP7702403.1 hypothetical protein [Campylobacter jejuni]EDP8234183.1 hypothetical protein [Campylobacter jejuni]EFV4332988.1 hypothetical protein [Campylobacter jejuni]
MINGINSYSSYNYTSTFNNAPNIKSSNVVNDNSNLVSDKSQAINKVLGYGVDKDGYFTSDFNEAAGIPKDYKIHSNTMQSFLKTEANGTFQSYKNIDIAKTLGNAYKIVSQLLEKSPELSSKQSFSKEDLANYFPQNYRIDKQSGEVKQLYSYDEIKQISQSGGFKNISSNESIVPSFFTMDNEQGSTPKPFDTNILSKGYFKIDAKQYTDENGKLTKAGLLVGFLSKNVHTGITPKPLISGETTIWGKIQGLDEILSQSEVNSLDKALSGTLNLTNPKAVATFLEAMNDTDIQSFKEKMQELKSPQDNNGKSIMELIEEVIGKHLKLLLNNENKVKRSLDMKV